MSNTMRSRVALIVLYDHQNRVLLQHRTDDAEYLPGYWAFFGGGIIAGEAPEEAVKRETLEELDYEIGNEELFMEQDYRLPNAEGHMYLFVAPYYGDKASLSLNEGQDWGWFSEKDVNELKMMDHDRNAVKSVINYLNQQRILFRRLESVCGAHDHEQIKEVLDSAESAIMRRSVFRKIISDYEDMGLFPVGYYLMFIKWLIQGNDLFSATKHINRCLQKGVAKGRISQIVYENLIRPDESVFRDRFNMNMQLLKSHGTLFSGLDFNFDQIKSEITVIVNQQDCMPEGLKEQKDGGVLLADVVNIDLMRKVLERDNILFLAFDDIKKFYYMLLFESMLDIEKYIKSRRVMIFADKDKQLLNDFFSNYLVMFPDYYYDLSSGERYRKTLNILNESRIKDTNTYLNNLKEYYSKRDSNYYRELLSGSPSDIRVMFITSERTELNKFITKNWYSAFLELGYQSKLLIENEPYEKLSPSFLYRMTYEYKPDMVFYVNHSAGSIFRERDISDNLLWIMRYRDMTAVHSPDCENLFVTSMVKEWVEDLIKQGMPDERILYFPDGVNLDVFTRSESTSNRFACDVVSVNNSGGDEFFRFTYLLNIIQNDVVRQVVHELYAEINEMGNQEQFLFFDKSLEKLLYVKLVGKGIMINEDAKNLIVRFFTLMMFAFFRRKVVEWIIDSGITKKVKVWGRGWSNYDKFKDYHMGIASYGEELSTIYSSSKIAISDHPNIPLHERNFEILACGGFPIVKYVKPENGEDIDYISNYFRENEEIVLFYNKDDLLNKVQYYLDNPVERERISENGRNVVIRDFSSVAIAGKTMDIIKKHYVR